MRLSAPCSFVNFVVEESSEKGAMGMREFRSAASRHPVLGLPSGVKTASKTGVFDRMNRQVRCIDDMGGQKNSRKEAQKPHKQTNFCASCAFSWLIRCILSCGLLYNRMNRMQSFGGCRRPASAYLISAFCFRPLFPFPLQIFKEPAPGRRTNSIIARFAGNASGKIRKRFLTVFSGTKCPLPQCLKVPSANLEGIESLSPRLAVSERACPGYRHSFSTTLKGLNQSVGPPWNTARQSRNQIGTGILNRR